MNILPQEAIQTYRSKTYRLTSSSRIKTKTEAVDFVNERGFIFFWPINMIDFPSLWVATAGDRPVPNEHDDPGHITWQWKDDLLSERKWYYGKIIRKKATIISLDLLPYFYAQSSNYGSPDQDYLELYEQGLMSQEAKSIYQVILQTGPLDTITLKQKSRLHSKENEARFSRGISELQTDFMLMPIGIAEVGSWRYAYIYEIPARYFQDLIENSRLIDEDNARMVIFDKLLASVGYYLPRDICRMMGWSVREFDKILNQAISNNLCSYGYRIRGSDDEWIVHHQLLEKV